MKKILSILSMLMVLSAFGQTEPKYSVTVDVVKYREVPEILRDQYVVPLGERWKLFNITADRWEQWNGSEWVAFGGDSAPILITEEDYLELDPEDRPINADIIGEAEEGSSGGIQSVVAGTNISVDNTDPDNPVISAPNTATASVNFGNDNRLLKSSGTGKDIQATGIVISDTNVMANVLEIVATDGTFTDVSANSIVKNGATNNDVLLGDGTTTPLSGIGGVSNGDKGDIIVSGSGDVWLYESGSINSEDIANNAITLFKMADGSVDTAELVNGAVTTTKIEDGSITQAKLNSALYEEDDFTPTVIDGSEGGGSGTYTISGISEGYFTRFGNQVTVSITITNINTSGSPSDTLYVTGLPYSASGLNGQFVATVTGSSVSFYSIVGVLAGGAGPTAAGIGFKIQTSLDGENFDNFGSVTLTSSTIRINGTYITTD